MLRAVPALADALLLELHAELDELADALDVDRRVTERHRRAVGRMLAMLADYDARRGAVAAALGLSVQPRDGELERETRLLRGAREVVAAPERRDLPPARRVLLAPQEMQEPDPVLGADGRWRDAVTGRYLRRPEIPELVLEAA
jgi:hypothetical protein